MQTINQPQLPVTDSIIALLRKGIVPWHPASGIRPWPRNHVTGQTYKGINFLVLASHGYNSPFWLTPAQLSDLGGQVINGYEPVSVVARSRQNCTRCQQLLNLEQCAGISMQQAPEALQQAADPVTAAMDLLASMADPPGIEHHEAKAYYCPPTDTIVLPHPGEFDTSAQNALLLLHLLVHSTAHPTRLRRQPDWFACFDLEPFSKEELIASIGGCLLCAHLGISVELNRNMDMQAAGWLRQLLVDPGMVLEAAQAAQDAARYIAMIHARQLNLATAHCQVGQSMGNSHSHRTSLNQWSISAELKYLSVITSQ